MANKNRDKNFNNDNERPEGWFDPQTYREGLDRRNGQERSNYQQTSNPNLSGRYDELQRRRMQNEYKDKNSFNRQYGMRGDVNYPGYNDEDRSSRNMNSNRPARYGDNFEQPARYRDENERRDDNERRDYRDQNYENRSQSEDRGWLDKASDEVASWFGNDDAERRRRIDKINGPHQGKGPKGYSRTDDRIREDINECLYHDSFVDASEVEIKVENGEAVLTGTIDSRDAKRRIEDIVERIPGVRDVENRLKVTGSGSTGTYNNERGRDDSGTWNR